VLGSNSRAERLFLILTLAFLAYPIAAFLGHPNTKEVLSNLVWPHFPATHAFLVFAVALIGTTITPYMQFYAAAACVDKGIKPADYRAERIDAVTGAIYGHGCPQADSPMKRRCNSSVRIWTWRVNSVLVLSSSS